MIYTKCGDFCFSAKRRSVHCPHILRRTFNCEVLVWKYYTISVCIKCNNVEMVVIWPKLLQHSHDISSYAYLSVEYWLLLSSYKRGAVRWWGNSAGVVLKPRLRARNFLFWVSNNKQTFFKAVLQIKTDCLRTAVRTAVRQCFSTLLLQRNLQQMYALLMEPYAMIQVSTLLQPHRIVFANFVPGNFGLVRRNPGRRSRNPEVPWNSGWKTLQ